MASESVRPDIFVSYAHVDNQILPGVENGWVTELIRGLKILLSQSLGRKENYTLWMDYELRGNQSITPDILSQLESSRTLLLILSPGYLASSWCRREIDCFLQRNVADSGRIFVVEPVPTDPPDRLRDLMSYRFYDKSPEDKLIRYGWPSPNPRQQEYFEKLDDLARDIAEILKKETYGTDVDFSTGSFPQGTQTVFLAEVNRGLQDVHDSLRRFLKDESLSVFPVKRYPPPPHLENVLREDLQKSDLFILLLDNQPNPWAAYYLEQARQVNIPLLLWHSPQLNLKEVEIEDHRRLLCSEEVLSSDSVDLQNEILRRLYPVEEDEAPNDVFLFLNHAPEDSTYVQAFKDHLDQRGIGYVIPLQAEEFECVEDFQRDRENSLLTCDVLLVVYFDACLEWVREQLMLCRRVGVRREQNLKGLGICKLPGAPVGLKLPNLNLQEISCEEKDVACCIDTFLKKVML